MGGPDDDSRVEFVASNHFDVTWQLYWHGLTTLDSKVPQELGLVDGNSDRGAVF